MRKSGFSLVMAIIFGLLAESAFAVDLTLQVRAQNPTSINEVSYFVAGVVETVAGAEAVVPQNLHNQCKNTPYNHEGMARDQFGAPCKRCVL